MAVEVKKKTWKFKLHQKQKIQHHETEDEHREDVMFETLHR